MSDADGADAAVDSDTGVAMDTQKQTPTQAQMLGKHFSGSDVHWGLNPNNSLNKAMNNMAP